MSQIPHLSVPNTNESVSALCLGMADFGSRISRDQSFAMLDGFAERGGTFFDVAHIYAFWAEGCLGVPERILGEWLRSRGAKGMTPATKGGHSSVGSLSYPRPDKFLDPKVVEQDLTESMERLGLDQIPLYYLHRDDPRVPVGELMDMMSRFVSSGRVKWIGASNWGVDRVKEAHDYADKHSMPRFRFLQNQWSLAHPTWANNGVGDVRFLSKVDEEALVKLDVISAPWSPNAAGWFVGKKAWDGQFQTPENEQATEAAQKVADSLGVSVSTVAIAWLINRPGPISPILGTGSLGHLDEAIAAFSVPPELVINLR